MKWIQERYSDYDDERRQIVLLVSMLPPPISLDILCAITGTSPVKILQVVEELTKARYLSRHAGKGAGYYQLTDFTLARPFLTWVPQEACFQAARQCIAGIIAHLPDKPKQWLHLAHVYQMTQLPVTHFRELINAGHYCRERNLPIDAAQYYRMALDA
ncbi:hypothetical protein [Desulfosarcina cetonica]|uniref:hypothetical protein n=1 Tax=Desulfosarcina cetonica TaxID=90730 RepID=UPI0006CFFA15|nr:hypothetical protein [Desulfosarcina cetonica]